MPRLGEGCHWLGNGLTDLIIIRVWSPIYRRVQGLWSRPLGVFKMTRVASLALHSIACHGLRGALWGWKDRWQEAKQERGAEVFGLVKRLQQGGRNLGARAAPGELRGVHPRLHLVPHLEAEGGPIHKSQPDLPEQWPEADLQIQQQQLLQGCPQGPSGGQRAQGQEQTTVYHHPEVPEEPHVGPGHLQEHGPGLVGQQDPRAQEPLQEQDCAGWLSGWEPQEAGPHGIGAGGHSSPREGGQEAGWGPTEPGNGGGSGADGEPALVNLLWP